MKQVKVTIYCEDEALRSYLQRILERCGEIQVVFPPPADPVAAEVVVDNYLTPLEVQRLQQLVDYGTIAKAAEAACVSVHTFKNELAWIRAKLGVSSTLEAVLWALRKGYIWVGRGKGR